MRIRYQAAAAIVLLAAPFAPGDENPLLDAAKKRQDAVRSVDVRYRLKEFIAKGTYSDAAPKLPGGKERRPEPPNGVTLESNNRLAIDGANVRFEHNHPLDGLGGITQKLRLSLIKGEGGKVFFPEGMGSDTEPLGIVTRDGRPPEVHAYYNSPLLLHFRGVDSRLSPYKLHDLKPCGETAIIEGKSCRMYQYSMADRLIVELLYDAESGYLLRRIRGVRDGKASDETDIHYEPGTGVDWVPTSWVRNDYSSDGKVRRTITVTVSETRINPKLGPGEFDIAFPPGTRVDEQRERKEYRVAADGGWRELDLYGNILGETAVEPWWQRSMPLLIGAAIAIAILMSAVVWRRRRRRAA